MSLAWKAWIVKLFFCGGVVKWTAVLSNELIDNLTGHLFNGHGSIDFAKEFELGLNKLNKTHELSFVKIQYCYYWVSDAVLFVYYYHGK